jgi:hypothetical protein
MRTTNDFDMPVSGNRQLSRRSVMKAGAHAAWIVPAVQVVGAAPAFASCSTGTQAHAFTFEMVSASWAPQGGAGKQVLTIIYRISDSDPCPMPGLTVLLEAPSAWNGIQDHSTAKAYGAKKVDDGKGRKAGMSDTWSFTPVQVSPGNWYIEMKVQASNSAVNHGTLTLTASLDGHSESTTFEV